jgi:autotransporter-associated beta strand protein
LKSSFLERSWTTAPEACSVVSCSARLFSHESSIPPRHAFHRRPAHRLRHGGLHALCWRTATLAHSEGRICYNLSTTFSGVIGGGVGGSLTKIGTGTLDLTGANTYTGNTNINGGVLKVDGSITSNTFVNHGGTLAGAGTVSGNVTNSGKIMPGDAPGTLTINGNYTQSGSPHHARDRPIEGGSGIRHLSAFGKHYARA